MTKIIITGGTGRFGNVLKKYKTNHELFFPTKNQLDILNVKNIKNYFNKTKPKILIHLAGLSRPMQLHKNNIHKSIDLNIIGTANVTKVCAENNVKLIYFSTNYVYQGTKGNYLETDPVLPVNNYAWSKLGGEASVQLYQNSLILRLSMTEKPFVHKKAFVNVINNFLYHDEVAKILFKLIKKKGVINVGGKVKNIYDFAKKSNPEVKKVFLKKKSNIEMPINSSINISKLKKILKKN
jgi:dTDP-4-dehydrorhamnose reductase